MTSRSIQELPLKLEHLAIRSVVFGAETRRRGTRLEVDSHALRAAVLDAAPDLTEAKVHLVQPGEAARIACVKDVIEPRVSSNEANLDDAVVRALDGVAVVTCGRIVGFQEGLIDMSGPGAAYTPFSSRWLVVLEADVARDCEPAQHESSLRAAGLAAANLLARAATGPPDAVERYALAPGAEGLPRVAYLYMVLSQGLLHDTWVEGRNAREGLPRRVDPRLGFAGGIVSGNCVSACDKNTTWHHQNNAVVKELFRRHGRDLAFAGCVLTHLPTRLAEKERSAARAVELIRELDVRGVVLSKEGFGNPDADLMMLVRALEGAGIATVSITDEFAGQDGASQSLADTTPEARALVSVGNANERVVLPPMARVVGSSAGVPRLAGAGAQSLQADGGVAVELQALVGATNEIGFGRLRAHEA